MVFEVQGILRTIKDNLEETRKVLGTWETNLMFERKDNKIYTFEELRDSAAALSSQRHKAVQDDGKNIIKYLSNSNRTLKVIKFI